MVIPIMRPLFMEERSLQSSSPLLQLLSSEVVLFGFGGMRAVGKVVRIGVGAACVVVALIVEVEVTVTVELAELVAVGAIVLVVVAVAVEIGGAMAEGPGTFMEADVRTSERGRVHFRLSGIVLK